LLNGGLFAGDDHRPADAATRAKLAAGREYPAFILWYSLFTEPLLAFIALPYLSDPGSSLVGSLKILAALALRHRLGRWLLSSWSGSFFVAFGSLLLFSPFARATSITLIIGSFWADHGGPVLFIDAFPYPEAGRQPGYVAVIYFFTAQPFHMA